MRNESSVGVVQLGARNHYLTACALSRAGMLQGLYTDAYAREGHWKTRLAMAVSAGNPERARIVESRRADLPDAMVKDAWSITLRALLQRKLAGTRGATASDNASLARALTRFAIGNGLSEATVVYGHCSASPELFRYARRHGMKTMLEQASATVATSERIMQVEYERWPGWALEEQQDVRLYEERQTEELSLVDTVVAPSLFVKRSLLEAGVPEQKIETIPYGFNADPMGLPARHGRAGGPLRVLYLGNVTLQKGVQYLLEAASVLGGRHFEFRVVGSIGVAAEKIGTYRDLVRFLGRIPEARPANIMTGPTCSSCRRSAMALRWFNWRHALVACP